MILLTFAPTVMTRKRDQRRKSRQLMQLLIYSVVCLGRNVLIATATVEAATKTGSPGVAMALPPPFDVDDDTRHNRIRGLKGQLVAGHQKKMQLRIPASEVGQGVRSSLGCRSHVGFGSNENTLPANFLETKHRPVDWT